jgi:hypothetical protein
LRDLDALVKVATAGGVSLWLHGHRHNAYRLVSAELAPFPVVCSGSATQTGRWSYGVYAIEDHKLRGQERIYDGQRRNFRDGTSFEIDLPVLRAIR